MQIPDIIKKHIPKIPIAQVIAAIVFFSIFSFIGYYLNTPDPFYYEPYIPGLINIKVKFGFNKYQYFTRSQEYFTLDYLERIIGIYIKNPEIVKNLISDKKFEDTIQTLDTKSWYQSRIKDDMLKSGAVKMIYSKHWHIFFDKNDKVVLTRYESYYLKND